MPADVLTIVHAIAALPDGWWLARKRHRRVGAFETEFMLPQPSDATFVIRILGGRIDRASPWTARIQSTGDVEYRRVE